MEQKERPEWAYLSGIVIESEGFIDSWDFPTITITDRRALRFDLVTLDVRPFYSIP